MENCKVSPNKFFHFVGDFGTHTIPLKSANDYPTGNSERSSFDLTDREIELRRIHGIVECIAARHTSCDAAFYFDGRAVRKVSHERAACLMRKYMRQIRGEWNTEGEGR